MVDEELVTVMLRQINEYTNDLKNTGFLPQVVFNLAEVGAFRFSNPALRLTKHHPPARNIWTRRPHRERPSERL